jgi:hypothetical protein
LVLPFRSADLNGLNAYWNIVAVFLLLSNALVFEPQSAKAAGQAIVATLVIVMMLFAVYVSFHRVILNFICSKKMKGQGPQNDILADKVEGDKKETNTTTGGVVMLTNVGTNTDTFETSGPAVPPPPPSPPSPRSVEEGEEDEYIPGAPKLGFNMAIFAPSSSSIIKESQRQFQMAIPVSSLNQLGIRMGGAAAASPVSPSAVAPPMSPKSPSSAAEKLQKSKSLRAVLSEDDPPAGLSKTNSRIANF